MDGGAFGMLLAASVDALVDAAFPSGAEGARSLDALRDALDPASASAFDAARTPAWDATANDALGPSGANLREALRSLGTLGAAHARAAAHGRIVALAGAAGVARLEATSFGGVDAGRAGCPGSNVIGVAVQAGDTLAASATLYFAPTRYVGALALDAAHANDPAVATLADALPADAACDALASALPTLAGCDAACVQTACAAGLGARLARGLAASETTATIGTVTFSATASATLDTSARVTSLTGTWVGMASDGLATADARGTLTAAP